MKRRDFLNLSLFASAGFVIAQAVRSIPVFAADKKLADKDVLKDGQAATIANYCAAPDKSAKTCKERKEKTANCKNCGFFNKDNSLTDYKGGKVARCMLLTDPSKAQYVSEKGWCSTYNLKTS